MLRGRVSASTFHQRLGLVVGSFVWGCSASPAFELALDERARFVLVFSEGSDGEAAEASVISFDSAAPLRIPLLEGHAWVLGYVEDPRTDLGEPGLRGLRRAARCEPSLPAPISAIFVTEADARRTPLEEAPSLTTPSLILGCPELSASRFAADLVVGGQSIPCRVRSDPPSECLVRIELSECVGARMTGHVQPDGRLCLDRSSLCEPLATKKHAVASFECATDPTSVGNLYVVRDDLPLVATAVQVVPDLGFRTSVVSMIGSSHGPLRDLTATASGIIVASTPSSSPACVPGEVASLHRIDLETLEHSVTATLGACIQRLAPQGDDLLAIGVSGTTAQLHRIRPGGSISTEDLGQLREGSSSIALGVFGDTILGLFDESTVRGARSSAVRIRAGELEWLVFEGQSMAHATIGSRGILAGDSEADIPVWIQPEGSTVRSFPQLPHLDSIGIGPPTHHEPTDRYLLPVISDFPRVAVGTRGEWEGESASLEEPVAPFAIAEWPADPALALIAGTTIEGHIARISFMEVVEHRYLPGALDIGEGIVSRARIVGRDVWLLLPWTGQVVRVSPR
ncbi:MAG: hypothetical protein HYV07_24380 [Deltaproteobacteria bacterium]|nr:hypothetical protein [Deltaproteobacteria bacterium]